MKINRKWTVLLAALLIALLAGCQQTSDTAPPDAQETPASEVEASHAGTGTIVEVKDEAYIQTLSELVYHLPDYIDATVKISGEVHLYGDEYPDLPITFAVTRPYVLNGEEDFVAIDCYYEGDLPQNGEWISVEGRLFSYVSDGDEEYEAPLLMVQSLEVVEAREPLQVTVDVFDHTHD